MVKLESLKKSDQFRKALKEKKVHTDYYSIFAARNFILPKYKTKLQGFELVNVKDTYKIENGKVTWH